MVEKILPEMNSVLCEMITNMFGQNFISDTNEAKSVILPPADKYMVYIQISGINVEGELIFSFNSEAALHLLESIEFSSQNDIHQRKLMHSILGEIANVVTGELMTHECFLKIFGHAHMHPPLVWDAEAPTEGCIPLRSGWAGHVENGNDFIKTFIACSKTNLLEVTETDFTQPATIKVS